MLDMRELFQSKTYIHPDYFLFQVLISLGLERDDSFSFESHESMIIVRDPVTDKIVGRIKQTPGRMVIEHVNEKNT